MDELGRLGIDAEGRLYWNGHPVEIIGRRLILTRAQTVWAVLVAIAGLLALLATVVQGMVAGHDWLCRAGAIGWWCGP